ncbi:cryptochrome/photolyase family protein [Lyngbya sp. CCY1209]|uniref:cryptochrome/photolyase family protein n=1 Tax=Lyngbya sp. CCY1209 TaxID=2886103 RepID=UPI002D210543|nr:cryptochrome/photolyase family protein [Lyngbya sp. CCY1209]MEB3887476.1 cryptochrome/photolyase family protein [Lyngbya sp. CCY1209]
MTTGIWILGDQLWRGQAALRQCDLSDTPVILIESLARARVRPYHRQKLTLIWSAMRHFARELEESGAAVTYVRQADDFEVPLNRWIEANDVDELWVMEPSDRPFGDLIENLQLPIAIRRIPNNHFIWSRAEFQNWAESRKRLVMEDFYRQGRRRFGVLMNGDEPAGGRWNFDRENRKPPKNLPDRPSPPHFEPDDITREVMERVRELPFPLYGSLDDFGWAVTRDGARAVLEYFLDECLPTFGPYQDAMVTGEETMWHGLISPYLNLGLLQPLEVVRAAQEAYRTRDLPLNSVEGFVRQVLGWREYMAGIYGWVDEEYFQSNWFGHDRPLPDFFWDGSKTDMNCLRQVLSQVERRGYAHHIQRLMVLANFALISGISPQAVEDWFHAAFVDAYDWVMQPNAIGMGLFADGGLLATKPYAASANYIDRMSDYCRGCGYDRGDRTGERACPFNFFYWDFLARHRDKLKSLGRMNLMLANLDRIDPEELDAIAEKAADWHRNSRG